MGAVGDAKSPGFYEVDATRYRANPPGGGSGGYGGEFLPGGLLAVMPSAKTPPMHA